MPLLNRDQILGARDLKTEDVEVPEWGGTVRVSEWSAKTQLELGKEVTAGDGSMPMHRIVAAATVDENGKPLFSPEDVERLAEKSHAALRRVFRVAMRLNGLDKEDAKKNSEGTPPESAPTG